MNATNPHAQTTPSSSLVTFHGSKLVIVEHSGEPYVAMRPIVEGMGLDWAGQSIKLRDPKYRSCDIATPSAGGQQLTTCIPLRKLNGWLFSINASKVQADIQEKVIRYQEECFVVLNDYWTKGHAINPRLADVKMHAGLPEEAQSVFNFVSASQGLAKGEKRMKNATNPHARNSSTVSLTPFQFENKQVRIVVDGKGVPWFNAGDVCAVLGYANPRDAIAKHVDQDDVAKRDTIDSMGRTQQVNHVNESGLYALIFGSTKPEAKRFKRLVTSEILPAIHRTGRYEAPAQAPIQAPTEAKTIEEKRALFFRVYQEKPNASAAYRVAFPEECDELSALALRARAARLARGKHSHQLQIQAPKPKLQIQALKPKTVILIPPRTSHAERRNFAFGQKIIMELMDRAERDGDAVLMQQADFLNQALTWAWTEMSEAVIHLQHASSFLSRWKDDEIKA